MTRFSRTTTGIDPEDRSGDSKGPMQLKPASPLCSYLTEMSGGTIPVKGPSAKREDCRANGMRCQNRKALCPSCYRHVVVVEGKLSRIDDHCVIKLHPLDEKRRSYAASCEPTSSVRRQVSCSTETVNQSPEAVRRR